MASTGTGFAAIIGSVLITFYFSNLLNKKKKKKVYFPIIFVEEIKLLTHFGNCHVD